MSNCVFIGIVVVSDFGNNKKMKLKDKKKSPSLGKKVLSNFYRKIMNVFKRT